MMGLINNDNATVFAPGLLHRPVGTAESNQRPWQVTNGDESTHEGRLLVSLLLHAPSYQDDLPPDAVKPAAMQGGVGRDTAEPRHGQVARLSQWDFGLTTGIWRLLTIARELDVPVAVALDAAGVQTRPGLAQLISEAAGEVVARGQAANSIIHPAMTWEEEQRYVVESRAIVSEATGRPVAGWFSPERATTGRTVEILQHNGFQWCGDWPVDEQPVILGEPAPGLCMVPFGLETEDMFALYARGLSFSDYEQLLLDTIETLIEESVSGGPRLLALSWFGWVLGQACFADVAERVLSRLVHDDRVVFQLPSQIAARATHEDPNSPSSAGQDTTIDS